MTRYLFITGLLFGLVGLYSLIDPNAALSRLGLHIEAVDGFSQERGAAGGVTLGVGVFLIASLRFSKLLIPALWVVVVVLGGLEMGRLVSLVVDGRPGGIIWVSMGLEWLGLLQVIFWLRQTSTMPTTLSTADR